MQTVQNNPSPPIRHWQSFAGDVTLCARRGTLCYQASNGLLAIMHLLSNDELPLSPPDAEGLRSAALALSALLNDELAALHVAARGDG